MTSAASTEVPVDVFREEVLRDLGFEGFVSLKDLSDGYLTRAPRQGGVYVVLHDGSEPSFLAVSCGGHFKGKDPTVGVSLLEAKWVPAALCLYVGKANELRRRLREFVHYGEGAAVGHQGGRYLWQLADAHDLPVAWIASDDVDPRVLEMRYLGAFRSIYGCLPFANLVG